MTSGVDCWYETLQKETALNSERSESGAYAPARKAIYKPVWHISLPSVQWINSWWWTDELSETCRVSCQNKFVKFVHLVSFIIKKFVTMHGHVTVQLHQVW